MADINSTAPRRARKPCKPKKPKDSPLFAHNNGQWAKKVRNKIHFFGVWAHHQKALERWLDEKDDLIAGRVPRCRVGVAANVPSLRDLVNKFLTTKTLLLSAEDRARSKKFQKSTDTPLPEPPANAKGELSIHTWNGYREVCKELVATFGEDRLLTDLLPEDFERLRAKWAAKWGPVRLGAEVNRARVVFNYAWKTRLIPVPMHFGEGFKRPSKKVMRLNREEQGPKMFEADELRRMIDAAAQPMKAMLVLAINAGLGNNDIGLLPLKAIDLERGWLNYPRPKTGIKRRCPLWPETIDAMQEWLAIRPTTARSEADATLVFLTFRGNGWTKDLKDRPITKETRKLLDRLKITGNRNFYAIRHTFETIGGESRDQVAVNAIMGHDDGGMASVYRERISDDRLQAVSNLVRAWLFAEPEGTAQEKPQLKIAPKEHAAASA